MSFKSKSIKFSAFAAASIALLAIVHHAFADSSHDHVINKEAYKPVAQQIEVSSGDKIEVAELFWFGCGGCYALEPSLKQWLKTKPENVEFKKIPAIFSSRWQFHGKAFYTMQALDVPEKAYDDFFNNIHVKRRPMNTLNSLIAFLEGFGKTEEQVTSAFNSFDVDNKVRAAIKISRQSGATGVPNIIVDGKYLTSPAMAQGTEQMFEVVEALVKKAESERK